MAAHSIFLFFTTCFVALFPVIDPIGSGLIVNGYFGSITDAERKKHTQTIFLNCLMVGTVSLLAGHLILLIFGLAVPAIQIAGGVVICKSGLEWLNNSDTDNLDKDEKEGQQVKKNNLISKIFYPISFPICLGPGTISVIFTLMATAEKSSWLATGVNYAIIIIAMILQLVILYFVILSGSKISRKLGPVGNLIINKLIAFITFCIGIQILLSGIGKAFHLTIF
ncbi:MAG: MarC family protein [Candidatus Symbiothrix sp.]|jgi:MarC family membrane protein|nr:MarC family protein [Candidatus Symbiothrix sp.]